MKVGNRQNAELNVENTGLGVLRYSLDRGDGCGMFIHYVGNYLPQIRRHIIEDLNLQAVKPRFSRYMCWNEQKEESGLLWNLKKYLWIIRGASRK